MHIDLALKWTTDGPAKRTIEPELFYLLGEISRTHSLYKAAQTVGVSYRHAWGLIKKWEAHFNEHLVDLRRGRGQLTRLTKFGDAFYSEYSTTEMRLAREYKKIKQDINKKLDIFLESNDNTFINISASNDWVINLLGESFNTRFANNYELRTRGSIENLKLLAEGECNIAGFHFPLEKINDALIPQYKRWLDRNNHVLVLLSVRRQGIMVSKTNAKKIQNLSDLTKRSVRYINRQKRSGTRIIFDELIKQAEILPNQISGYHHEEFTHIAVAAMIASGAADAGMGLEVAARQFKLHFIPQVREAYFLAFNKKDKAIKSTCLEIITSEIFRKQLKKLPGYDVSNTAREIPVSKLLANKIDML